VSEDFYHDDPIDKKTTKRFRNNLLTPFAIIIASVFFFQSTLAGNVSLNSGRGIEFGQSVSQAVACSGATDLTLSPRSTFINGSPGAHYLNSVTVSNIPTSCYGVDFTIGAYNNSSSSPLALFNSTSTNAVVYNDNGTFLPSIRVTGMTVESGAGTFTATFTTPVAQSSSVFKLTIQSGVHFVYKVGDRGPGGGIVYYVSASNFTSTGSTCDTTCRYLEVAPANWQSGGVSVANDTYYQMSDNITVATGQNTVTTGTESGFVGEKFNWKIGQGFYNTSVMKVSGATSAVQAKVLAYAGGSTAGQWFLPSMNELNELCKYARGQTTGALTVACTSGGTLKSGTANDLAGFGGDYYWASSEIDAANVRRVYFGTGAQYSTRKNDTNLVRPVRAF
jgi:hypothetical protein